jgi:hypothetical protein
MHPKGANGGPDRLIAQVAARQHAVIAIDELLAAGLSHQSAAQLAKLLFERAVLPWCRRTTLG